MRIREYTGTLDEAYPAFWLQSQGFSYYGHFWEDSLDADVEFGSALITKWLPPTDSVYTDCLLVPTENGWRIYFWDLAREPDAPNAWILHKALKTGSFEENHYFTVVQTAGWWAARMPRGDRPKVPPHAK